MPASLDSYYVHARHSIRQLHQTSCCLTLFKTKCSGTTKCMFDDETRGERRREYLSLYFSLSPLLGDFSNLDFKCDCAHILLTCSRSIWLENFNLNCDIVWSPGVWSSSANICWLLIRIVCQFMLIDIVKNENLCYLRIAFDNVLVCCRDIVLVYLYVYYYY